LLPSHLDELIKVHEGVVKPIVVFDKLKNFLDERELQSITLEERVTRDANFICLDVLVVGFPLDSICPKLANLNFDHDILGLFFHFYKV